MGAGWWCNLIPRRLLLSVAKVTSRDRGGPPARLGFSPSTAHTPRHAHGSDWHRHRSMGAETDGKDPNRKSPEGILSEQNKLFEKGKWRSDTCEDLQAL